MKLTSKPLAAIVFIIFFGGIALTSALGWFQTETTKVPVTYTEGEFAGQYNPADIRGSYLFGDISSLFGVPLEDLETAFHFPEDVDPASYQVKDVESQFADSGYEIGTEAVRLFVGEVASASSQPCLPAATPTANAAMYCGKKQS